MEQLNKNNDPSKKLSLGLDLNLESKRQKIIEMLKTNDIDSCTEVVSRWCEEAEKWATKGFSKRRMVIINFAKYDFYIAVNDMEGALDCAEDAMYMASQEGYTDLELYIESKLK